MADHGSGGWRLLGHAAEVQHSQGVGGGLRPLQAGQGQVRGQRLCQGRPALDPAPCTPVTKQQCRRVPGMFCAGSPGLACDNVAREVTTQVTVDTCLDMPMRVCRNVTHWDTREECHEAEVTRCGPIPRTVDTPREEEVCRHTSQQQCRDVTRTEVISVPREVTKQKCVPITVTQCRDVEVEVPERRCVNEDRPVCTVATHNKCFNVKKEVNTL